MITSTLNALRTYMRGDGAVLLPEIELVLFAVGILVMDSWATQKERYWSSALALAGVVFSGLTLWMLRARILLNGDLSGFHETVIIDSYFLFFATLLLAATLLVILLSVHAPVAAVVRRAKFCALLLFSCAGLMLMISAVDLLVMFFALEIAALSSHFLAATLGSSAKPHSSAVKFLLNSFLGSAILAYGFSILYGLSASTNIAKVGSALTRRHNIAKVIALSRQPGERASQMYQLLQSRLPEALHWHPFMLQALPIIALVLIIFALCIKLKSLPIQFFGAKPNAGPPLTVALYLSGAFVITTLALLLRLLLTMFGDFQYFWWYIVAALAVAFIVCGVIASLCQKSFEGILATASLAQFGYLLLGFVSGNEAALTAVGYYLFTYLFILSGAFAVLLTLRRKGDATGYFPHLSGLRQRNPLAALLLIIFVIALAGFPPTAGFFARYFIFNALLETGHRYLAWFAAFSALPLAFSYLRIAWRAWRPWHADPQIESATLSFGAPEAIVLGACAFVSLAAGLYSEPFLRMARYAFGQ
jgi:NADH-quinone oxidoreductase subunit N